MRSAKGLNGERLISVYEFLTTQQVASFFFQNGMKSEAEDSTLRTSCIWAKSCCYGGRIEFAVKCTLDVSFVIYNGTDTRHNRISAIVSSQMWLNQTFPLIFFDRKICLFFEKQVNQRIIAMMTMYMKIHCVVGRYNPREKGTLTLVCTCRRLWIHNDSTSLLMQW